jgi:hypothetical protein
MWWRKTNVTWEVITAVSVNITFLSDVTPCVLVETYRRFRTTGWLHLHVMVVIKLCPKMVSVGSSESSVHFQRGRILWRIRRHRTSIIVAIVRKEGRKRLKISQFLSVLLSLYRAGVLWNLNYTELQRTSNTNTQCIKIMGMKNVEYVNYFGMMISNDVRFTREWFICTNKCTHTHICIKILNYITNAAKCFNKMFRINTTKFQIYPHQEKKHL